MKQYKVLERIWFYNNDYNEEYCETFNTLKRAQKYVDDHADEWEADLREYAETAIDVVIETWNGDELLDSTTSWCMDK